MPKKETIIVFCAHSDDQIIGVGGTLAKYAKEDKKIFTYIFSYGESSHPHLKRKVIVETRVKESQKADRIIGGQGVVFFGIDEGKFPEQIDENKIKEKMIKIIEEKKPSKIFTHSIDDPHPDHKSIFNTVMAVMDKTKHSADVYCFEIWNPFTIRHSNKPKMVVDIKETFKTKIKAANAFKSQKITMVTMIPAIYSRAIINGLNNGIRYAEVFYKAK